jgi:hypothetical protein
MTESTGFGESSGLGLRLGHSCHRMLVWECEPIARDSVLELPAFLTELGYSEQGRSPLVRELFHPCEHSVVIVPRTGRVQIRVHYLTPLEAREAQAKAVATDLGAFVEAEARRKRAARVGP